MKRLFPLAAAAAWLILSSFTIHLAGDSTMAEKNLANGNPERGWGMMFKNFLDSDVNVINNAQNGRSTKSFIDLGLWRMMIVASNAVDLYGSMLVVGVMSHLGLQVVINVAVVTNVIPNTGIPLPFISYGGTAMFMFLAEIGIVISVARRIPVEERE